MLNLDTSTCLVLKNGILWSVFNVKAGYVCKEISQWVNKPEEGLEISLNSIFNTFLHFFPDSLVINLFLVNFPCVSIVFSLYNKWVHGSKECGNNLWFAFWLGNLSMLYNHLGHKFLGYLFEGIACFYIKPEDNLVFLTWKDLSASRISQSYQVMFEEHHFSWECISSSFADT